MTATLAAVGPVRRYAVATIDGRVHEVNAVDAQESAGQLRFFTGELLGETPVVAASFRSAFVAWWRWVQ